MSLDLPKPVAAYFAAEQENNPEAVARCFAPEAVVRDEGQTIQGLTAIKEWQAATRKKYQHTVEPLTAIKKDGTTIVTSRVAGNFPGSPIDLPFVFRLQAGKIASLQIG
jgi:hypothetical protein